MTDPLDRLLAAVAPVDRTAAEAARRRHAALAKPAGSLGALEELGIQLAGIAGRCPPPPAAHPALVIAAGDHGVHRHGVSPWPQEVTALMVGTFCDRAGSANALAGAVGGVRLAVLDAGIATPLPAAGGEVPLHRAGVRPGTRDLRETDAMTTDECVAAVLAGARTADVLLDAGADLLIGGDMGIANTTAAAALIGAYTGRSAAEVTGRGTGIDDDTYRRKQAVVGDALARHGTDRPPLATLAALGGLEHAALTGVYLAGAARRVPVLLDGVNTVAAGLAVAALCPPARDYLIAGHRSVEPGATVGLDALKLTPLLDLGMRLGEGTGALLAVTLVRGAAAVLRDVRTLAELGVG